MRELISISVGQAGLQIGNIFWELFFMEHGINEKGEKNLSHFNPKEESISSIFAETEGGKFTPRAIFVDLETSVIDQIKYGKYKNIYCPDQLIAGKEGAAHNFCRGHYTIGKEIADLCLDNIRKQAEKCNNLEGFMITNSMGGGTGSGLCTLLMERMSVDYGKKIKANFSIFPSPKISPIIVEPYNTLLCLHCFNEHSDFTVMFDNEALYNICTNCLNIEKPSYFNINSVISQVISSLTVSIRFNGSINNDLKQFCTNLIPYPRIHYLTSSLNPIMPAEKAYHEEVSTYQITNKCFDPSTLMVNIDPSDGKYTSCCLMYRGDVHPNEICTSSSTMKLNKSIKFVDWCPTGFKTGINPQIPITIPNSQIAKTIRSLCMISNTTAIKEIFAKQCDKFDKMYAKRAFTHWFVGEGMESGEFSETRMDAASLVQDYEEIQVNTLLGAANNKKYESEY